jgi:hypothetical protein
VLLARMPALFLSVDSAVGLHASRRSKCDRICQTLFWKQYVAKVNWTKDRNRRLANQSVAQEFEDLRLLGPPPSDATIGMKASLRTLAENIDYEEISSRKNDPRGSWKISCRECGAVFIAGAALSTALETPIDCPACCHPHRLSEGDIEIPWD